MKKLYIYLSLITLLAGCQKNEFGIDMPQGHQLTVQSVELVTVSEWSSRSAVQEDSTVLELADGATMTCEVGQIGEKQEVVTRGTPMGSANDISAFKINLFNTGTNDWSTNATASVITATKDGSSFTCNPSYNWRIKTDKVTLLSYTPAVGGTTGLSEVNPYTINYTVPEEAAHHPDFCATTDINIKNDNGIKHIRKFYMRHKLAAVGFALNGWNVKITKVELTGVGFSATYNLYSDSWTNLQTSGSRTCGVNGATVSDAYNPNKNWTNATANDGYMMMIPQTLDANAKAIITYVSTGGTATGGTITAPLNSMTSGKWVAGQKITYNIQFKMAPAVSTEELVMGGNGAGGFTTTSPLAFGTKDPKDVYTFTWNEDWLYIHHGGEKENDTNGGASSGWKKEAPGLTHNIWFFSKEHNISSSARIATVTMTGKRTGTRTFTVKQEKYAPADGDYTGRPANCYITQPGKQKKQNN